MIPDYYSLEWRIGEVEVKVAHLEARIAMLDDQANVLLLMLDKLCEEEEEDDREREQV